MVAPHGECSGGNPSSRFHGRENGRSNGPSHARPERNYNAASSPNNLSRHSPQHATQLVPHLQKSQQLPLSNTLVTQSHSLAALAASLPHTRSDDNVVTEPPHSFGQPNTYLQRPNYDDSFIAANLCPPSLPQRSLIPPSAQIVSNTGHNNYQAKRSALKRKRQDNSSRWKSVTKNIETCLVEAQLERKIEKTPNAAVDGVTKESHLGGAVSHQQSKNVPDITMENTEKQLIEAASKPDCLNKAKGPQINSFTVKPGISSMDVQSALLRAREKLQGALQKRARARQNSSSLHYSISALSAPLIIECVNNTGSRESVFFPTKCLPADLGRLELEKELAERCNPQLLAARKMQLQQELLVLKGRLERQQQDPMRCEIEGDGTHSSDVSVTSKQALSKKELEMRKEKVQTIMDISHWKHFVYKQENMLTEASDRVAENRNALEECNKEQIDTIANLTITKEEISDLEAREQAVANMIEEATSNLLLTRKNLSKEFARTSIPP